MLSQKQLGFIGGGNMAKALIGGLLRAKLAAPNQILVYDVDGDKMEDLAAAHGIGSCDGNVDLVQESDLVILAVKPQTLAAVLEEIAPAARTNQCFISIAAGVTLARLEHTLGKGIRIIRVMPNTPALIGSGAAGIARGAAARDADVALARAIFEAVGVAVVVEETRLDAVTAVSGSGPAYLFHFVEVLQAAAEAVGLESDVAELLVKQTVLGAARMVDELARTPAELREAVTSPGGTTAAALNVLGEGDFAGLIRRAVEAAVARSVELGKA